LQKAFWRFEEIGCNWFLYKLMLQQLLYVWTSEPASELLSFSLSLSLKVANYVCLPACLPRRCLFACAQTLRLTLKRTGSLVSTVRLMQARALGCAIAH
jgi:hypothetical protein